MTRPSALWDSRDGCMGSDGGLKSLVGLGGLRWRRARRLGVLLATLVLRFFRMGDWAGIWTRGLDGVVARLASHNVCHFIFLCCGQRAYLLGMRM